MKQNLRLQKGRCVQDIVVGSVLLMIVMLPSTLFANELRVHPAKTAAEAGLVDVRGLAPAIALDMRYASSNNFTGRVVPGYVAPRCYLLRPAAEALARVAHTLNAQGYRLQVFDCYRPVRSVQAFVAWAADLQDQATKAQYYPQVDKRALLGDYIAPTSGHSRGATLDLGLLDCRSAPCRAVDMGTDFDFFDARAHTDTPDISAAQRAKRRRLLRAMAAEGFANYPMEWWHFTLRPEPTPDTAYDVPVD
ncbi:M15 family metallopeptidase [Xanthomonas nasturtii]|nr:M15 family metallopeptidase [Xanthomonas nasturtii]MCL1499578.1 M15 family metallopeptidase [Xanthomonas nasturtii]MCL1503201.1 M15 family metallopeptidase [Xanthomonas nasturtii]MCL1523133.1 M15 family metallopeptidase [Xanthomonas nasturtii]